MLNCGFESDDCSFTSDTGKPFIRSSTTTPSTGTGPSAAYEGSYYAYAEAGVDLDFKTPIMSEAIGSFSFWYHMYGTDIGTLKIQYSTDGSTWTTFSSISGNKGDSWYYYDSANHYWYYSYGAMYLRWYYTSGSGSQGDAAIDKIEVSSGEAATSRRLADGSSSTAWSGYTSTTTVYNDAGTAYTKIEGPETLGGSCPNLCSGHGDCYR